MNNKNFLRGVVCMALVCLMSLVVTCPALAGTEYSYKTSVILPRLAANITAEQLAACETVAQAIENGQTEFTVGITSIEQFMQAYSAYAASNPLSALVKTASFNAGTVYVEYIYGQREMQDAVQLWRQKIDSICSACSGSETDIARQLNIAVAKSIKYGAEYLEGTKDSSVLNPYFSLMQGEGLAPQYVKVYDYLLMQFGIDCIEVHNVEHYWTIVNLNGQYYHVDPTCDSIDGMFGGDYSYCEYFGIGDVTRAISGPYETYTDAYNLSTEIVPACPADMQ